VKRNGSYTGPGAHLERKRDEGDWIRVLVHYWEEVAAGPYSLVSWLDELSYALSSLFLGYESTTANLHLIVTHFGATTTVRRADIFWGWVGRMTPADYER
jgi:uncharacterized protein YgfB (UPF0149 family)